MKYQSKEMANVFLEYVEIKFRRSRIRRIDILINVA